MNLLAELKVQQSLAKKKFIDFHLYWTEKNNRNSIAMDTFSQIISAMPDSSIKSNVEELFLSIKKGRPDFSQVKTRSCKKYFLKLNIN